MKVESRWSTARFPSRWLRGSFLEQLERWNDVEGLPTVQVEPLVDGKAVRFWAADGRVRCVTALARAYGGRLLDVA